MFVIRVNIFFQLLLNMTYGNVLVQLQTDNAVPPPMGTAIVFDIRQCVSAMEERRKTV